MAEALQTSEEADLSLADTAEVDGALLKLEQALHRREALIVVTSENGRQHSSLVRTALARFDEAYVVVLISPANAEPILALDRLLETAGHEIGNATGEEKQAALGGLIDRAGELGRPVIVVVDDAHLATVAQLERLRTALNIDPGSRRPVQLVLAGTQKLVRNLKSREARGLWTRVTAHIDIAAEEMLVEEEREVTTMSEPRDEEETGRRWPLVTLASAGALVVALLIVASLARNHGGAPNAPAGPVTAIEPARPAHTPGAPVAAEPASPAPASPNPQASAGSAQPPPAMASSDPKPPAEPSGMAAAPAQTEPQHAATEAPGLVVTGAPSAKGLRIAMADTPPSSAGSQPATSPPGQAPAEGATAPQTGPRITQWLGVEQIHGSAGRQPPPAATPEAKSAAASAPAPAQPSSSAAQPSGSAPSGSSAAEQPKPAAPAAAAPATEAKRGAHVVEVEDAASTDSPATIARAAVAADMAKASQPSEEMDDSEASKSSVLSEKSAGAMPATDSPSVASPQPAAPKEASVPTAAPRAASGFDIQLGAFRTMANAAKVRDAVIAEFPSARVDEISVSGATLYRVRVGPLPPGETSRAEERLRSLGFTPVRFNSSIKKS